MKSNSFPDPRTHKFAKWAIFGSLYYPSEDIIEFGVQLTTKNLEEAYQKGIFPWHIDGLPLPWFCPAQRAILEFKDLHIPKSLKRAWLNTKLKFTIDKDFKSVIESCARIKRPREPGTWITKDFTRVYNEFHRTGRAHSVEVWDEQADLVGGLYGVDADGVFCGESMFFKKSNASKFALLYLINHLKSRGATWIDIQVMTPHFEKFGAKQIKRLEFLDKLKAEQDIKLKLF